MKNCKISTEQEQIIELYKITKDLAKMGVYTINAGEWNEETNYYQKQMLVSYNGSSYIKRIDGDCINLAPNLHSDLWQVIALKGEIGVNFKGEWVSDDEIKKDDAVTYKGSTYIANENDITTAPELYSNKWSALALASLSSNVPYTDISLPTIFNMTLTSLNRTPIIGEIAYILADISNVIYVLTSQVTAINTTGMPNADFKVISNLKISGDKGDKGATGAPGQGFKIYNQAQLTWERDTDGSCRTALGQLAGSNYVYFVSGFAPPAGGGSGFFCGGIITSTPTTTGAYYFEIISNQGASGIFPIYYDNGRDCLCMYNSAGISAVPTTSWAFRLSN